MIRIPYLTEMLAAIQRSSNAYLGLGGRGRGRIYADTIDGPTVMPLAIVDFGKRHSPTIPPALV